MTFLCSWSQIQREAKLLFNLHCLLVLPKYRYHHLTLPLDLEEFWCVIYIYHGLLYITLLNLSIKTSKSFDLRKSITTAVTLGPTQIQYLQQQSSDDRWHRPLHWGKSTKLVKHYLSFSSVCSHTSPGVCFIKRWFSNVLKLSTLS